ncbi:MAG: hypothetical protein EBX39_08700, partial [Actinobacteria bacterium]|nr:hypothetical protein [Actinomycetota bacterium]
TLPPGFGSPDALMVTSVAFLVDSSFDEDDPPQRRVSPSGVIPHEMSCELPPSAAADGVASPHLSGSWF